MDGCKGSILGRYHNIVFGLFNIKGRDFNFPIHFNKFLRLKVWMDEWMDGWMDGCERGKTLGRYHNMVFGLFTKRKGF